MIELTFSRLDVENLHGFLNYFDHEAFESGHKWSSCYCQFYLDPPEIASSALELGPRNRQNACDRVGTGDMTGYLAYSAEQVVGWCAAGASKLFANVPGAEDKLARILCFVIHPLYRGQGVARSLMRHAVADLTALGFAAVEASPYTQPEQLAANYRGHLAMYLADGFEVVQDMGEFGALVRKMLD